MDVIPNEIEHMYWIQEASTAKRIFEFSPKSDGWKFQLSIVLEPKMQLGGKCQNLTIPFVGG